MLDGLLVREIWAVDFEFYGGPGDRPLPVCLVAQELRSRRRLALWQDELQRLRAPPIQSIVTRFLSLIIPALKLAVITLSVGRHRSVFSTCLPSFAR